MKKTLLIFALAAFAVTLGAQSPKYVYTEAAELNLIGKILKETPNPYHRVDTVKLSAKAKNDFLKQHISLIKYDTIDYGAGKGGKAVLDLYLK